MEYIQTILFQIHASRLEHASQADGLLPELDEHRQYLKAQPGFRDIRITRSINNEGNVLVVVETRWTDDASLVRYETNEPNSAGIVRRHQNLLVPDTLQVLDMEALRTEASWRPQEQEEQVHTRLALPILVPLGVLALALLFIYGLSRVYLQIGGDGAVVLAAALSIGVLIVALWLASAQSVSGLQIGGVLLVAAGVLFGGVIWAVLEDDPGAADEPVAEEPGGEQPGGEEPGGGPAPGGLALTIGDNFFEFDGEKEPTIRVPVGEEFTIALTNDGAGIHNMHVAGADGEFGSEIPCETTNIEQPCSDPNAVRAGQTGTLTANLLAGDYKFRCDFHPTEMSGTLEAQ